MGFTGEEVVAELFERLRQEHGVHTIHVGQSPNKRHGMEAVVAFNDDKEAEWDDPSHFRGPTTVRYREFEILDLPSGLWAVSSGTVQNQVISRATRDL